MRKTPLKGRSCSLVTAILVFGISSCVNREPAMPGQKISSPAKAEGVDGVAEDKATKDRPEDSKAAKKERVHVVIDENTVATQDAETIIEPIWSIANLKSKVDYDSSLAKLSRGQRLIFAISLYGAEMDNGGHDQFYFNSSGMVWEEAQEGFTEIGVNEAANILAESAKRMGGRPSFDVKERRRFLEEKQPNFDDLDDRYYNLSVDIDARMLDYIRTHPKDFLFDGEIERTPVKDDD
jgi:hypothetical protein